MDTKVSTLLHRMVWIGTIALGAMPLLGMRPMVLLIVMWSVLVTLAFVLQRGSFVPRWKECLMLSAPFLLMLLDLLRATDLKSAWHLAETGAPLLVFPVGFLLLGAPADERTRSAMVDLFGLSALLLALFANGSILLEPLHPAEEGIGIPWSWSYRRAFAAVSGVHPPYAAYWFFSGALFQAHRVLNTAHVDRLRGLLTVLLCVAGILIGSRMPIIAFAVALSAMLLFRSTGRKTVLIIGGTLVTLGILSLALPSSRDRIKEAYNSLWTKTDAAGINSVNVRTPILQCSVGLLEEHWVLGMGQAAVQPALDKCYEPYHQPVLLDGSYGTHDQPLHWWLSFGIPGLLAFILLFGFPLRDAFRQRDAVHVAFLVLMLLCCLTENILSRQWGVVLFACSNTLFLASRRSTYSKEPIG